MKRWIIALLVSIEIASVLYAQEPRSDCDPLTYFFDGRHGQVEVGGRYVGFEFHHSRPVPSRISFFYPVANSIDVSTDYWKRDNSMPMAIGFRIGNGQVEWIHRQSWSYLLSPHRVTFVKKTDSLEWTISYEFCLNEPAAVASIVVKNISRHPLTIELYTHLLLSLRTCQTYARRDSSLIAFNPGTQALSACFNYVDTDSAAVFVQNVGQQPNEWISDANIIGATDSGGSLWPSNLHSSPERTSTQATRGRGVAAFVYRKTLEPSDTLKITQIVGSCRRSEIADRIARLRLHWSEETLAYDKYVRGKAQTEAHFMTGNKEIDRSAVWARALIAANAHYLRGRVVPMPCPAEYNFFFTHDLLLTNLGAVNFDLPRVKENLLYLISLAKDSVIPHAYYWRDDGFKTEYCEPENWNHLWFVMVAGSYLRHSLDDSTGLLLYPELTKSVRAMLTRLHSDGLMYAYRPDWWDIGHIEGSRAYLTSLAIRALREYLFISSFLHKSSAELLEYERTADLMQHALVERLWDNKDEYLTNFNGQTKDYHFYAGSLIASVYELLDEAHGQKLVATAERQLVDQRIGIRIAAPVDFATDSVVRAFKFSGAEAGPPYSYANGGVWPHGNAWYALALKSINKLKESYDFIGRTMTIDGIAQSPNGLPAMYEYRSSDPNSQDFGTIDKPSFLWAGGMYLQVLYRLLAIDENDWNIGIRGALPSQCDSVSCSFSFAGLRELRVRRIPSGDCLLMVDGEAVPSRIVPLDFRSKRHWEFTPNTFRTPVLVSATAIVHSVVYDSLKKQIRCDVSSFNGHRTLLVIESENPTESILIDGTTAHGSVAPAEHSSRQRTTVEFQGSEQRQHVILQF
ncbi:MAG: hypothetical protein NTZ35_04265 [Ignavibacteriales bacterium]|nr:hypothetical protein [Ignavibacteriales bacterium]